MQSNPGGDKCMKRMYTICTEEEVFISAKLAKVLSDPEYNNSVMSQWRGEVHGLQVAPKGDKWRLSWHPIRGKTLMRDMQDDVWEEKETKANDNDAEKRKGDDKHNDAEKRKGDDKHNA